MNIVTGKLMPDEGKVEWAKNVRAGYLDQHAVLEKGMTIQDVLKSAFDPLLKKEERMNEICDHLGEADENEMEVLMEELGTIQDELTLHDFYTIDAKVEEVARALGLLDLGLDRDVTDLSGGQRTKVLLQAPAGKAGYTPARRAHQLPRRGAHRLAETLSSGLRKRFYPDFPRYSFLK